MTLLTSHQSQPSSPAATKPVATVHAQLCISFTKVNNVMDTRHPLRSVTGGLEGAVLEVLAGTTEVLPLKDVHTLVGSASKSGVRKALLRLVDNGVVDSAPGGYRLNRDHLACNAIVELANLRSTLYSRIADEIKKWKASIDVAGVFGSVARKDGDANSDIDLLIVGEKIPANAIGNLAHTVERLTGNNCHIVVLSKKELRTALRRGEPIVTAWRRDLVVLCGNRNVFTTPAVG